MHFLKKFGHFLCKLSWFQLWFDNFWIFKINFKEIFDFLSKKKCYIFRILLNQSFDFLKYFQIYFHKMGKKCTRCQKTSSGPTCRYYIAILISSLRDIFLPKIWAKKCPNLGKKTCKIGEILPKVSKNFIRSYM